MTIAPDYRARNALDTAIWESDLPFEERLALHGLRFFVNKPDGLERVWVARSTLKAGTGLPSQRAQRAMDGLITKGWLEVVTPGAGKRAAVYRIVLGGSSDPAVGSLAAADRAPSDPVVGASDPRSAGSDPAAGWKHRNPGNSSPLPPTTIFRTDLVAALEREGISEPADVRAVVAIATADPDTFDAPARLAASPHYRRSCVARWRADRDRQARARREAAEKCPECQNPLDDCERRNALVAVEQRCTRLQGGNG